MATEIGERNIRNLKELDLAADWLQEKLSKLNYTVERQTYEVAKRQCHNLIVEQKGIKNLDEIVLVCAHYDSASGAAGANDNGSGTAALLELAKNFSQIESDRTLRLAFFTNEEPPHFQTEFMGSLIYAKSCKERKENIVAAISLETIGYCSDDEGSQKYPFPSMPNSRRRPHLCPTQLKVSARRTNGRSGNLDIEESWLRTQLPFGTHIITAPATRQTNWTAKKMARVVVGLEKVVVDLLKSENQ